MAKAVKSNPFMISIAEKVGTTVGLIVAKTTDAVEGASKLVEGAARSLTPAKAAPVPRAIPAGKSKVPPAGAAPRRKPVKKVVSARRKPAAKRTKK